MAGCQPKTRPLVTPLRPRGFVALARLSRPGTTRGAAVSSVAPSSPWHRAPRSSRFGHAAPMSASAEPSPRSIARSPIERIRTVRPRSTTGSRGTECRRISSAASSKGSLGDTVCASLLEMSSTRRFSRCLSSASARTTTLVVARHVHGTDARHRCTEQSGHARGSACVRDPRSGRERFAGEHVSGLTARCPRARARCSGEWRARLRAWNRHQPKARADCDEEHEHHGSTRVARWSQAEMSPAPTSVGRAVPSSMRRASTITTWRRVSAGIRSRTCSHSTAVRSRIAPRRCRPASVSRI